jgi:5-hydroxyisourate hydrolase
MISTHVLDTSRGSPASGMTVRFLRVLGDERPLIATGQTNADGRIAPILAGEVEPGEYILVFSAGDYFRKSGTATFYEDIPVRFVIESGVHYHIPLLLAPFGYSTYRGS